MSDMNCRMALVISLGMVALTTAAHTKTQDIPVSMTLSQAETTDIAVVFSGSAGDLRLGFGEGRVVEKSLTADVGKPAQHTV